MATQSNPNESREQPTGQSTTWLRSLYTSAGALLMLCTIFMVGCDSGTSQNSAPVDPSKIEKGDWELIEFSSQEDSNDKLAKYIIDGDTDTYWHSQFDPERVNHPQFFEVDMKEQHNVTAFEFVHREAGNRGGNTRVQDIELQMSNDGESWEILGEYTLEDTRDPQMVELDNPESFQYFKIITNSSHGNYGDEETLATLAEVSAFEQP